jgi:hypothetical protein
VGALHCDLMSPDAMTETHFSQRTRLCIPHAESVGKTTAFVTVLSRVTEPGRVLVFQCADCEKLDFRGSACVQIGDSPVSAIEATLAARFLPR